MAYVVAGDGGTRLVVAPAAGGEARILTEEPGVAGLPQWFPDGRRIAYTHNRHVFVRRLGEGRPVRIRTDIEERRVEARSPAWSPDGRLIAFESNRGGSPDVLVADREGGYPVQVTDGPLADGSPTWSPDGREIAYLSKRCEGNQLRAVKVRWEQRSADWRSGPPSGARPELVAGRLEPGTGVGSREWLRHLHGRCRWRGAGCGQFGAAREVSPDWSADGSRVAFIRHNGFSSDLVVVALTDGAARVVAPARAVRSFPQWLRDGSAIAFLSSSPTQAADVWRIARDGGDLTQLTRSMGRVDPAALSTPDEVVYRSFNGLEIHALLFKPRAFDPTRKHLALIAIHGGPSPLWDNTYHPFLQYFAQKGFIVLAPNPRGSSGYGKAFEDMNNGDWSGGDLNDILASDGYLKSLAYVDPARIGLWGGSYGAFLSYMAVTKAPGRFKASVVRAGMPNLVTSLREHTPDQHEQFAREAGDNVDILRDRSAINFVDRVATPMLIEIGLRDRPLRVMQQREWVAAMRARQKIVEYVEYPDEGHGLSTYKATIKDRLIREETILRAVPQVTMAPP